MSENSCSTLDTYQVDDEHNVCCSVPAEQSGPPRGGLFMQRERGETNTKSRIEETKRECWRQTV